MVSKHIICKQIEHLQDNISNMFLQFIEKYDDMELCNRKNREGHITVSGAIIHLPSTRLLLLHHKTLDKWLTPGGHIDSKDKSLLDAAFRQIREETGIMSEQLIPRNLINGEPYCMEVDSHLIPQNEKKNEDSHYHHDFRFIFCYYGDERIEIYNNKIIDYKWFSINDPCVRKALNAPEVQAQALEYLYEYRHEGRITSTPKGGMLILSTLLLAYKSMHNYEQQKYTLDRLIKVCSQIIDNGDNSVLDRYAKYLSDYAELAGNISLIERFYTKAIEAYQKLGQSANYNKHLSVSNILRIHTNMLLIYKERGTLEKGDVFYEQLVLYYNGTELEETALQRIKLRIDECYYEFYKSINDKERTEKLLLSIVKIRRKQTSMVFDQIALAKSCTELAQRTDDWQLKKEYLLEAMEIYENLENENSESFSKEIIDICGNLSELYILSGQEEQAEPLIKKAEYAFQKVTLEDWNGFKSKIADCYMQSAHHAIEKLKIDLAVDQFRYAIEIYEMLGDDFQLKNTLELIEDSVCGLHQDSFEALVRDKLAKTLHRLAKEYEQEDS